MKELPKAYEPQAYEDNIYKKWEESGYFNPDALEGEPYSIMMPPPNVTGVLHLGHALENTLMDIMARYQRMQGKKVLLLPGTDHAAVATQARVEKNLMAEGMVHPREVLGREGLLEKIREYAEGSKSIIIGQIKKMGTSADWSRLAYTFDEDRSKAVNEVFKNMYDDGLIYRGYRVVNWSVKGQSTCSDDELEYVERPGMLYTFKYSKDIPIVIATTRPETKLGDTAIAVHPEGRWKQYIGQEFTVEHFGQQGHTLTLKVFGDERVEDAYGTGALGVTTAHSPIDFDMYVSQKALGNDIGLIQVIGEDGNMTAEAGVEYVGLSVSEAREKVVAWLQENNLLEKEEEIVQNVGTSDRFGDVVEAIPKTQWWLDVNKEIPGRGKSIRELMKEALTTGLSGDESKKVRVTPERFTKLYLDRVDNLRDWCLSRQIWWGHRIPVWYRGEEIVVSDTMPQGDGWIQDEDTLDTWFSSGMWTFSTLGWPEDTLDFNTFHPTSWMQMGYEILYLWLMRMVLFSAYNFDDIPFRDVYIHGMLRDKDGQKFSKSKGNGIDPIEVIKEYGTDALRYSLISGISPGNDSKFYTEKVEGARNLVTKLWNLSRFMLMNIDEPKKDIVAPAGKSLADKWILERTVEVVREVTDHIEQYRFSPAAELLRDFTWNELADWYLEISKIESRKSDVLNYVLNTVLKLWHPFTPFVTEAIWQEVYGDDAMLMVEKWPTVSWRGAGGDAVISSFNTLQTIITGIRALRAEKSIEPAKKIDAVIVTIDQGVFEENAEVIRALTRIESLTITDNKPTGEFVSFVEGGVEVLLDLSGAIDKDAERERIQKEIDFVTPYITQLEKKLSNAGFVDNAPEAVLIVERKKLEEARAKHVALTRELETLR
jgi:valyl-tRNA synthetase